MASTRLLMTFQITLRVLTSGCHFLHLFFCFDIQCHQGISWWHWNVIKRCQARSSWWHFKLLSMCWQVGAISFFLDIDDIEMSSRDSKHAALDDISNYSPCVDKWVPFLSFLSFSRTQLTEGFWIKTSIDYLKNVVCTRFCSDQQILLKYKHWPMFPKCSGRGSSESCCEGHGQTACTQPCLPCQVRICCQNIARIANAVQCHS